MAITSIAHVCIKSTDLDATAKFYCDDLGLQRQFNFTKQGKLIGFYMKTGALNFVEVFLADELEALGKQAIHHFCLETDDIQALHERLSVRGREPGKVIMGADDAWQFWMKDPSGLAIEIQQYTATSGQLTGRDVEVNW